MSLSNLIRRKSDPVGFATATPATFATQERERGRTVASVATVAVAKTRQGQTALPAKVGAGDTAPLSADDEKASRAWLALIEETDPTVIAEVISQCQRDADARDYFTWRAALALPKPDPFPDDRRTCGQCANLIARRCQAAKRCEIVASRNYEPVRDLPRRCEGYAPKTDDPDRRHGRERWPGLIQPIGAKQ